MCNYGFYSTVKLLDGGVVKENEEKLVKWAQDVFEENEELRQQNINLYQRIFELQEIIKNLKKEK